MIKSILVILTLVLLLQCMSMTLLSANDTVNEQNGQNSTKAPNEMKKKSGFNWTIAFILTSIISLIVATIIAIKQADKKYPEN